MLQKLIPQVGWGWATRIHGFLLVFLSTAGVLLLKSRLPPKKGAATTWRDMLPDFRIFMDGTGALALTAAGVFFAEWGYFIPITYIPSYSLANGVDSTFSYQILAIQNAASCFGRWLPGYVSDYIGRFNAMILTQLLCLVSVFCFWLPANGSVPLIVIFSVLFGFTSGAFISLGPICIGQLCDTQEFGRYYATVYTVVSFSSLTGVPIAGALVQACKGKEIGIGGGEYWGMVVFTGICYLASFLAFAAVRVMKRGWGLRTIW